MCADSGLRSRKHIVGGDYPLTWIWVLIAYHKNISKQFIFKPTAFQLTEGKSRYSAQKQIPAHVSYHFLSLGLHVDSQSMLGEGELFGASVINAETGRPLAKVDEGELTFGVFPSSLFSCPALCRSSFSLAWSRSYLDSSFIWVSSQLIPTRLWADKDLDMPIQTGIYILKMNFWSWGSSTKNRACQSGGWAYRLLSFHSADLHWADPGPFAFQGPVATPETNSFPWGDAPALYFSIIGKKKKKRLRRTHLSE